jgi:hypothetical protein
MPGTGRKQNDYTDINYDAITMKIDAATITYDVTQVRGASAAMIGKAVGPAAAADTVELVSDGEAVLGTLIEVFADGFCTVQHRGFTPLPAGQAATVTVGTQIVGALGAASAKGYIRSANSATAAELIKRGPYIINNADVNNVWCDLG